jgi:hypothetical protein
MTGKRPGHPDRSDCIPGSSISAIGPVGAKDRTAGLCRVRSRILDEAMRLRGITRYAA